MGIRNCGENKIARMKIFLDNERIRAIPTSHPGSTNNGRDALVSSHSRFGLYFHQL